MTMLVTLAWIVGAAFLVMVAGAAWVYFRQPVPRHYAVREVTQDLEGAEGARIDLDPGAASLHLARGTDDGRLISGQAEFLDEVERLEQFTDRDGATLTYKLRSIHPPVVREPARWPSWDLKLNPRLPLSLTLRQGMPASRIDLRGLRVTNLEVAAPVGRLDLTLPDGGPLHARVTGGVSRSVIHVAPNVPLRESVSGGGLGSVEVFGEKVRQGDAYEVNDSPNAGVGIDLEVLPGVARVSVQAPD